MSEMVYSLDRIEGEIAVLVADDGELSYVPVTCLPAAAGEGKMYRKEGETYVEDLAAAEARRERVRQLQNRLRRQVK